MHRVAYWLITWTSQQREEHDEQLEEREARHIQLLYAIDDNEGKGAREPRQSSSQSFKKRLNVNDREASLVDAPLEGYEDEDGPEDGIQDLNERLYSRTREEYFLFH